MRFGFVLLFALLTIGGSLLQADPVPMTHLRVEVKTYTDKPIERASVIVRFIRGNNVEKFLKRATTTWELKTNQEGVAKLPPFPQGEIMLQVIAKGYQTYGKMHTINEAERTIEVKMNAPQPQESAHQ